MVSFCVAERALAAGRTCHLLLRLLFLSLLPIDLANCCQFFMALTQSCYVTEGFGMVLLPLLRLLYGP